MSIIKSFSVGNGDMFYINHNSENFTIIDCNIKDCNKEEIVDEIRSIRKNKRIVRFISTHPDEDHLHGLKYLDEKIKIPNFYCVKNNAIKEDKTEDFKYYCELRDGEKAYYVYAGCMRKWLNMEDEDIGNSRINFLWPDTNNEHFKEALNLANKGKEYNNISPIFTYSLENGVTVMWMGDIESDFLEKIKDCIDWPEIDILFAPHHGRKSAKIPSDILDKLKPRLVIIGEAPSKDLEYCYKPYNTITQNSAGDIVFECVEKEVHVYISNENYKANFLENKPIENKDLGKYLGTFKTKRGN